jgi:RNA polymerase sigma-70 factor (ECF subfamily)
MPGTPSLTDLAPVYRLADRAAADLRRSLHLPAHEHDDLRQDLLCDLLARLQGFDPARGSLPGFAWACFQHRAARLARRHRREARLVVASLDAPMPGHPDQKLGDGFAEEDGLAAWLGQTCDSAAAVERRLDLTDALQTIDPDGLSLCEALVNRRVDDLARTGPLSRASLHRRLREVRLRLLVAGMAQWA